jgi:hypothetical protein
MDCPCSTLLAQANYRNESEQLARRTFLAYPVFTALATHLARRPKTIIQPNTNEVRMGHGSPLDYDTFFRERCQIGDDVEVSTDDLYAHWQAFCTETAVNPDLFTNVEFGRLLREHVPTVRRIRKRVPGGIAWFYRGVGIASDKRRLFVLVYRDNPAEFWQFGNESASLLFRSADDANEYAKRLSSRIRKKLEIVELDAAKERQVSYEKLRASVSRSLAELRALSGGDDALIHAVLNELGYQ